MFTLEHVKEAILKAWDNSVDFNLYKDENEPITCNCGSHKLQRRGYSVTTSGRYARYQCQSCGTWLRGKENLISGDRKVTLLKKA